jgi:AcrR family transcriptional regulator
LQAASSRQAIVNAAIRVLARRGSLDASLREIAHEAGYTPGALYKYFSGKDELFAEIEKQTNKQWNDVFLVPVPAGLTFAQRVDLLLRRLMQNSEEQRDACTVLVMLQAGPAAQPLLHKARFDVIEQFGAWVREHATEAELAGHSASDVGALLFGTYHAFHLRWAHEGFRGKLIDQAPGLLNLALAALGGESQQG